MTPTPENEPISAPEHANGKQPISRLYTTPAILLFVLAALSFVAGLNDRGGDTATTLDIEERYGISCTQGQIMYLASSVLLIVGVSILLFGKARARKLSRTRR